MTKIFLYISLLVSGVLCINATTITNTQSFDATMFHIIYDDTQHVMIHANIDSVLHQSKIGCPDFPWIRKSIAVPKMFNYEAINIVGCVYTDYLNAVPALKKTQSTTDEYPSQINETINFSKLDSYPSEFVRYLGTTVGRDGTRYVNVLVCPFYYNKEENNIKLLKEIKVRIKGLGDSRLKSSLDSNNEPNISLPERIRTNLSYSKTAKLDYLIITQDSLTESFSPLLNWKREKGLNCDLITLEEINKSYSEEHSRVQDRVKQCISDLYYNHGLEYVLLGGDGGVIPSQDGYCRDDDEILVGQKVQYNIPCDVFYSEIIDDIDWDSNGNGIYGEVEDGVTLYPDIAIGRVPFRSNKDISIWVDKVIKYEKNPDISNWTNKALFTGSRLYEKYNIDYTNTDEQWLKTLGLSNLPNPMDDATYSSMRIYRNAIIPYSIFQPDFFLSDYTNISEYSNVSTEALLNVLNRSYSFVNIDTHGSKKYWDLGYCEFNEKYASKLNSIQPCIILTTACHTNNFTYGGVAEKSKSTLKHLASGNYTETVCLSEAILKSENYNCIAYIGSSSYGWTSLQSWPSGSELINTKIYDYLFSNRIDNRNLGKILQNVKQTLNYQHDCYNTGRWLLQSVNLSGDPETQIYTETPMKFKNVEIIDNGSSFVYLTTDITDYQIKIGYKNENGVYEFAEADFNKVPTNPLGPNPYQKIFRVSQPQFIVAINAPNHIPIVFYHNLGTHRINDTVYLESYEISKDMIIVSDRVVLKGGSEIDEENDENSLEIHECKISIKSDKTEIGSHTLFKEGCFVDIDSKCTKINPGTKVENGAKINIKNKK